MLATLLTATSSDGGFSWKGLLVVAVVFAIVWPVQDRLRKRVSERRRGRWAQGDDPGAHGSQPPEPPEPPDQDDVDGPSAP